MNQLGSTPLTASPSASKKILPAAYREFFTCFNAGRYFEAHEVLEALWRPARGQPEGRFYQGLIQLAGAFVHFQKGRSAPALALLRACLANLAGYPAIYAGLDVTRLRGQVANWMIEAEGQPSPPLAPGLPWLEPPTH